MKRSGQPVDISIYGRGLLYLVRNPSILAMPLLAAVIDMAVSYGSGFATDAVGGLGNGIIGMIVQIVYLFAFGIAIIQANNIARGYKSNFDDAWEEGKRKAMGILLAAIGFQFITWVAGYIGSFVGIGALSLALQLAAYFFLIYTIPAAAIGGLPGGLAISGSIRAVRSNPIASLVLAAVFVLLYIFVPQWLLPFQAQLGTLGYFLTRALVSAITFAYLAFPFASTYDDIAFKTRW